MQFQSGQYEHIDIKDPKKLNQTNSSDSSKQLVKKELLKKNDLQEKIAPNISKDYMDISNPFLAQMITVLDTSIKILNCQSSFYFWSEFYITGSYLCHGIKDYFI